MFIFLGFLRLSCRVLFFFSFRLTFKVRVWFFMDNLTEKESEVVELDDDGADVSHNSLPVSNCMVGKLITERSFNAYALMDTMKKSWREKGEVTIREWGKNFFLCQFKERKDMEWVINHQPWHFDNNFFAVRIVDSEEQPSSLSINMVSLWMRAYDLPVSCMREASIHAIAKQIGELQAIDRSNMGEVGRFLRFKVACDVTKPLFAFLFIIEIGLVFRYAPRRVQDQKETNSL